MLMLLLTVQSFGVLLSIDDFVTVNHHGIASSLLTVAWFFVVLVIITLYTANMVRHTTTPRRLPIHSFISPGCDRPGCV